MISESRLIGYVKAKASKPTRQVTSTEQSLITLPNGQKTYVNTTGTQSAAQANNAAQVATHQSTPAGDGVNGGIFVGNLNPETGQYQSNPYVPSTGPTTQYTNLKDAQDAQNAYTIRNGSGSQEIEAQIFNLTNRLRQLQGGGDSLPGGVTDPILAAELRASNAAEAVSIQQQLDNIQKKREAKASSGAMSSAAAGIQGQNGNRFQGPSDSAPDRQTFIEQQRAAGKTDAEIRQMINTLPPEQTGGVSAASTVAPMSSDAPGSQPAPKGTETGSATASDPKAGSKGTPKPGDPAAAPVTDPSSSLLRNIAATVEDPIMQAILMAEADRADALAVEEAMGQAEFNQGADAKAIAKPFDAIDKILDRAYQTAEKTYQSQKDFLAGQYDRNEKLMAQKEASIQNQLSFAKDKAVRDQTDLNKKALDQQTIMLALEGGFGSHDGNMEVVEARQKGEQALIDLTKEFGFKMADVSLQFTEMHNQAFDNYQTAWLTATDNFESRVANIDLDGISNQQAKSNAIGGAYKDYVNEIKAARQEQAKVISDATKMVYDHMNTQRSQQFQRDQAVIGQAEWAISTYGSAAKPFIEKLQKDNPSVSLAGLMGGQTLTEANQNFDNQLALLKEGRLGGGGGGGGSGGLSFSPSQINSSGQPISFDEFIRQKESDAISSGAVSFDTSPKAMAQYKREYETKLAQAVRYTPDNIRVFLEDRVKNISEKNVRENAIDTVQRYMSAGQYELAYNYVDGLGKNANATQQNSFSKAASAKQNVNRLAGLIEEMGTIGPVIGRFRSQNPYDDRVVEFDNLVRQTVPGLARGIFGEVGVLTDSDIKNYTATIANPNLTLDQARTATKNLLHTINLSVQNQLDVARASGVSTRDLNPIFQSIPDYEFGAPPAGEDPDEAFVRTILLK